MGIDQKQDGAVEQHRQGKPNCPAFGDLAVLRKDTRSEADGADADAGEKIGGIKQDTAGLYGERVMAWLEPGPKEWQEMLSQKVAALGAVQ